MRYIFNNFLNTLKRYKVSSLLNIIGMAVAFAAFYVIMTQVCFNLGYNKSLRMRTGHSCCPSLRNIMRESSVSS